MRCPSCGFADSKVVDSRTAEEGASIRRRRECLECARRFTTFERAEEAPLVVVKRSGDREPFDRTKIVAGVAAAAKGRPLSEDALEALALEVEEAVRLEGVEVTSAQVGVAVLERLRRLDEVVYLRFASVYKGFGDAADFERELSLLAKDSPPRSRSSPSPLA